MSSARLPLSVCVCYTAALRPRCILNNEIPDVSRLDCLVCYIKAQEKERVMLRNAQGVSEMRRSSIQQFF